MAVHVQAVKGRSRTQNECGGDLTGMAQKKGERMKREEQMKTDMKSETIAGNISELSYEAAAALLEKEVALLESGQAGLEASMDAFVRGTALLEHCRRKLDEAEGRVRQLSSTGTGEIVETEFPDAADRPKALGKEAEHDGI